MARLYRKKPLVVEAVQFEEHNANIGEVIDFLIAGKVHHMLKSSGILIRTPSGDMLVEPGDYIIRGCRGEFYPCPAETFYGIYEDII